MFEIKRQSIEKLKEDEKLGKKVDAILRLFRLRLHEPYFMTVYYPIQILGNYVELEDSKSGSSVNKIVKEMLSNEEAAFKLLKDMEIDVTVPATSREIGFIEKVINIKDGEEVLRAAQDFFSGV